MLSRLLKSLLWTWRLIALALALWVGARVGEVAGALLAGVLWWGPRGLLWLRMYFSFVDARRWDARWRQSGGQNLPGVRWLANAPGSDAQAAARSARQSEWQAMRHIVWGRVLGAKAWGGVQAPYGPSSLPASEPASASARAFESNSLQLPASVLFVHGFVCNHAIWLPWMQRARGQGAWVHAVDLEPLGGDIDGSALAIEAAAEALIQASGQSQIWVVSHSMGGLVSRAWRRMDTPAGRQARFITLGTPHRGTRIGAHLPLTNVRQMQWDSPWLQALAQSEDVATRGQVIALSTVHDNIVYPAMAQHLPGMQAWAMDGVGHLAMVDDPQVMDWAFARMAEPAATAGSASA